MFDLLHDGVFYQYFCTWIWDAAIKFAKIYNIVTFTEYLQCLREEMQLSHLNKFYVLPFLLSIAFNIFFSFMINSIEVPKVIIKS